MNQGNFLNSTRLKLLLFLCFVAVAGMLSLFHEFWRDEVQAWLLVHESVSLRDLMANSAYEGHPSLWFLMLWVLKQVAPGLIAMRVLHLAIASGTAWLVIYRSPFPLWQRALLVFGYFFLYEYTLIVRNYAFGLFFLLAFCSLYPRRNSPFVFLTMSLMVMAMMVSNFYAFFLGLACVVLLAAGDLQPFCGWHSLVRRLPGYVVMVLGIILFLADTYPPADYGYAHTWHLQPGLDDFTGLLDRVCCVFLPLPERTMHYWNTILFPNRYLRATIGLAILASIFILFDRNSGARWFIGTAFTLLLAFSLFKFGGYYRHNGHLFIAFIALLWIQHGLPGKDPLQERWPAIIFTFILVMQVIAALMVASYEAGCPFSQAEAAGKYISARYPEAIVIADEDLAISPVSAWLPRKPYYPVSGRYGTYIIWNRERLRPRPATANLVAVGDSLQKADGRMPLILTNYLPQDAGRQGLRLVHYFGPSVEPAESYYLFVCSPGRNR